MNLFIVMLVYTAAALQDTITAQRMTFNCLVKERHVKECESIVKENQLRTTIRQLQLLLQQQQPPIALEEELQIMSVNGNSQPLQNINNLPVNVETEMQFDDEIHRSEE